MTDKLKDEIVAPREPTREMLGRGFDALDCTFSTYEDRLKNIADIYKAMTEDCDEAPPVPDDVAEAIKAFKKLTVLKDFHLRNKSYQDYLETLIKAATKGAKNNG